MQDKAGARNRTPLTKTQMVQEKAGVRMNLTPSILRVVCSFQLHATEPRNPAQGRPRTPRYPPKFREDFSAMDGSLPNTLNELLRTCPAPSYYPPGGPNSP